MNCGNNFTEWVRNYTDILEPEYDKFYRFFESNNEEPPNYHSFLQYVFLNTKKYKSLGKLIAPIH
jgi:hypothetical protein